MVGKVRGWLARRFALVGWEMAPYGELVGGGAPKRLIEHVSGAGYPVRMARYWLAGQAIAAEARRRGRPLRVVDLGCERGWLKWFTPAGAVESWIGLDWNPRRKELAAAGYDEVREANFDETLPLAGGSADVVVVLHVFEHLPRPGFTMAEISRLLRPGGICVAGAPTAPGWIARLRERFFRRRLRDGKITVGGHINSLSPGRWRRLAYDTGLETEILTGTHGMRLSGSRIESSRLWVRLNQLWGGLFPALGSDCYLVARRGEGWASAPEVLHRRPSPARAMRLAYGGLGAAAVASLAWLLVAGWGGWAEDSWDESLNSWMDVEQDGDDRFFLHSDWHSERLDRRVDLVSLATRADLPSSVGAGEDVHLILSEKTARHWESEGWLAGYEVTSSLEIEGLGFALLEPSAQGRSGGDGDGAALRPTGSGGRMGAG